MTVRVRTLVPDFYEKFKCKAGACRHTCCQVWEIDVDDYSAEYYFQQTGKLGQALRRNIRQDEEGYHLKLNQDGFCPFLQKDGLCHLIVELGEDSLCDICAAHPRFYEFFQGDTEDLELGGVGMCCEATCELLLENNQPLQFYLEGEANALDFAQVLEQTKVAFAGGVNYLPRLEMPWLENVLDKLAATEPIDEQWTSHLAQLQKQLPSLQPKLVQWAGELDGKLYTKIFHYILYRQLEKCRQMPSQAVWEYGHLNMSYILLETLVTGNLPETLRRWSEQIEYDEDNVVLLLQG